MLWQGAKLRVLKGMVVVMMDPVWIREVMVMAVVVKTQMLLLLLLYPDILQVTVLADKLVHPPIQLFYPRTLGLDQTLLVLDDGGELPQVQNRLHWVF